MIFLNKSIMQKKLTVHNQTYKQNNNQYKYIIISDLNILANYIQY